MIIAEGVEGAPRALEPSFVSRLFARVLLAGCLSVVAFGAAAFVTESTAYAQTPQRKKKGQPKKEKGQSKKEKVPEKKELAPEPQDEAAKKAADAAAAPAEPPKAEGAPKEETATEGDELAQAPRAIYASAELGFTRSDVGALADDTGFDRTGANGVLYGLSAGLRLDRRRLGLQWRVHDTTEFSLWSFAVSAGYELPMKPLTPIFSAHLGYVFTRGIEPGLLKSSIPEGTVVPPDVSMKGVLLGIDVSAAYALAKFFAVGPYVGADLMLLSREKAEPPRSIFGTPEGLTERPLYRESGSGLGVNFSLGLRGTFDIALD